MSGSFDDDDTSIFISLEEGLDGEPVAVMESGGDGLAVSNLYSSVITSEDNDSYYRHKGTIQLTWTFSESFDIYKRGNILHTEDESYRFAL